MNRGKPMRARSVKRAAQERTYRALRRPFLEANPWCQFPTGCGQPATELHHRRGRVGALLTDDRYWSALCHEHHAWTTGHPAEAYRLGVSERRVTS